MEAGFDVVGIENDMRAHFFGPSATRPVTEARLLATYPDFRSLEIDIRDEDAEMRRSQTERMISS